LLTGKQELNITKKERINSAVGCAFLKAQEELRE
jgi:hypothetical protein